MAWHYRRLLQGRQKQVNPAPQVVGLFEVDFKSFHAAVDKAQAKLEDCQHVTDACGSFQCAYCGRFGAPGACQGCGAPNRPAPQPLRERRPDGIIMVADQRMLTVNEARRLREAWEHPIAVLTRPPASFVR